MSTLVQDLRFAARMLVKTPVVTLVAAVSLAVGIAANTTMFALADGFLFQPLPFADQDELVFMWETNATMSSLQDSPGVSGANFLDYAAATTRLEAVTAFTRAQANLTGRDVPEQLRLLVATPNHFDVLGVAPWLGRGFRPEEGRPGAQDVLVLQHDFWESRFQADPGVLGRTLTLDGRPHTVVGVMPADFQMIPADIHAWRPSNLSETLDRRGQREFIALGRLLPGATREQAEDELAAVARELAVRHPEADEGWTLRLQQAREYFPGPTDTRLIVLLSAVTMFGLLIACANVANLLLGRAESRQREVAVRTALGAGKGRILRQLLTESVLLGLGSGGLGVLFAVFLIRWVRSAMPAEMPVSFMPTLDLRTLSATVAISIGAGVVFGLLPAVHAVGGNLREALGEGMRGGTAGRRRKRLRSGFVIAEVAVALALLTGAGYLTTAFEDVLNAPAGFDPNGLLTFRVALPEYRYGDDGEVTAFHQEVRRVLEGVPGVESVATMSSLPRGRGNPSTTFLLEGAPEVPTVERPTAGFQVVNPGYFAALGVVRISGRGFVDSDRADGTPVLVVNQAWVDRNHPDADPLGARVRILGETREIVGVVGDVYQERISSQNRPGPGVYLPLSQRPSRSASYAIRAAGDPRTLAADVRAAVWSVDPDLPVDDVRTLEDFIAESLAGPKAIGLFLTGMGAIALFLAAIGLYGVMAHAATQRTREIGIRMALGADGRSVLSMMTWSGLALAGVGLAAGLPLSWLMYRGVLFTIAGIQDVVSPAYTVAVGLALVVVTVAACWLPAFRAARIHPVRALQAE